MFYLVQIWLNKPHNESLKVNLGQTSVEIYLFFYERVRFLIMFVKNSKLLTAQWVILLIISTFKCHEVVQSIFVKFKMD